MIPENLGRIPRHISFLLSLLCWFCLPVSFAHAATILIYHHFGVAKYPTTNVGVEQFQEQMDYLAANNYHVITLATLVDSLHNQKQLPPKAVVITIDDGYESIYRNAWPILRRAGYPFSVFINARSIDAGYENYLNWDEILEMHQHGVDFQDHSYSHYRMAEPPEEFSENDYRRWIRDDLRKNSAIIASRLGEKPRFFAIPYGEYNRQVMDEARSLGYEAILTQDPGSVSQATDPYQLPREPILGLEWSTLGHFQKILQRVDLPITEMKPAFGNVEESPPFFGARISDPARYASDSFKIYVSEFGWLTTKREGAVVSAGGGRKITRKLNRVMIMAREKESGLTAVRSWLLMRGNDN